MLTPSVRLQFRMMLQATRAVIQTVLDLAANTQFTDGDVEHIKSMTTLLAEATMHLENGDGHNDALQQKRDHHVYVHTMKGKKMVDPAKTLVREYSVYFMYTKTTTSSVVHARDPGKVPPNLFFSSFIYFSFWNQCTEPRHSDRPSRLGSSSEPPLDHLC